MSLADLPQVAGVPDDMIFFRIATVARAFDVTTKTVRRWEQRGLAFCQIDGVTMIALLELRRFVRSNIKPLRRQREGVGGVEVIGPGPE